MPDVPSDWAILLLTAAARLLLPLLIPRYPLAGILAALLLDGIDQSLFQQFTTVSLAGYQGYDKALDIYYLTLAYVSTLRNWEDLFALQVGRFLFYWRLVGVTLFEVTGVRWLLLIFPNTFEYFYIFYEVCRFRWDPRRLPRRLLLGTAALIWIAVKLPQEYWLHIARLDVTDWLKTGLLGMPLDRPWIDILAARPGLLLAGLAVLAVAVVAAWALVVRRLPPPDRSPTFRTDVHRPAVERDKVHRAVQEEARQIVDAALVEKVVLIALVSISFAHVMPGLEATDLQLALGLTVVVTLNTALTHWSLRRGSGPGQPPSHPAPRLSWRAWARRESLASWALTGRQFVVVGTVNALLALGYVALRPGLHDWLGLANALFFALLLTLLVTLFDHYRLQYLVRFRE